MTSGGPNDSSLSNKVASLLQGFLPATLLQPWSRLKVTLQEIHEQEVLGRFMDVAGKNAGALAAAGVDIRSCFAQDMATLWSIASGKSNS